MPIAEMTPKQRREGAPLFRMLEEKLVDCLNDEGELNLAFLARRIGVTRQAIHTCLNKEAVSPSIAYHLLATFPENLTLRDIRPFVQRS